MSPESIVSTGFSEAAKKPRCTVVGDDRSSCIFSSHCASAAARMKTALKQTSKACDLMVLLLCFDIFRPIHNVPSEQTCRARLPQESGLADCGTGTRSAEWLA